MESSGSYQAYMLRMWSVERSGQAVWRASLEDPFSGEILGFPNIDALIDYLRELVGNYQIEGEGIQKFEPHV